MDIQGFLQSITSLWLKQIEICEESKEAKFGKTARRLWDFLGKSYRQLYLEGEGDLAFANARKPLYKSRISKSAEAVAILVPWVLSQLPHRRVTPRRPALSLELQQMVPQAATLRQAIDQQDLLGAYLLEWFLNYTVNEFGLKREARTALPEAFVKGRGILWHEMVDSAAGLIPSSQFESVDNLLIDSDAIRPKDAGFIMRGRDISVWKLSEISGLPREYLRGVAKSGFRKASGGGTGKEDRDVCRCYEVYSRVGIGHWLDRSDDALKRLGDILDDIGRHIHLMVMDGVPFPLNLNPANLTLLDEPISEIGDRLRWPIPFWADMSENPWPYSALDFYPHQADPWATSPLEPGLPMQVYLDHLYSFAMSRIAITSRNIGFVAKALEQAARDAIEAGNDLTLVPVDGEPGLELDRFFKMLEFPKTNEDLWTIAAMVERAYERATGLDPRLYGSQGETQLRSAKEAALLESHVSSRPDDYADATEDWLSAAAGKEQQMARQMVDHTVVAPIFGEQLPAENDPNPIFGPLTEKWLELVYTEDPFTAAAQYACRVEAGQARRQNKAKDLADVEQTIQTLGQPLVALALQGLPGPFNALMEMMGEAHGIDVTKFMIPEGFRPAGQEEEGAEGEV